MVVDGKLTAMSQIEVALKFAVQESRPLVIVAEHITVDLMRLLRSNHINGAVSVLPIKSPGMARYRKEYLNDICTITGATLNEVTPNFTYVKTDTLGSADKVTANIDEVIVCGTESPQERIEELTNQIGLTTDDYEKELLEKRIGALSGKVSIIEVGGSTPVEMNELFDRIEDAVLAVRAGYQDGVVTAGKALYDILEFEFFKTLPETELLVPAKVLTCAVINANSVTRQIRNLGSIVLPKYLWNIK